MGASISPGRAPSCPFSLKETENRLPFDFYSQMRAHGEVVWDDGLNAWIATSAAACREVFASDKVKFRHPDGDSDGDYARMAEGLRPLKALTGDDHRKLHNWLMIAFSPKETAAMMDGFVREVIQEVLLEIKGRDRINLVSDFVDKIPVRVIAAALDLPWRDPAWISQAQGHLNSLANFFNRRMSVTPEVSAAAREATRGMRALLEPILEQRRGGDGSDLISKLWRDGPGMLPDWSISDTFVHINTVFLGGYDTSTLAISNALYLLMSDSELMSRIKAGGQPELERFVEETLRLLPPIHYRARRANDDVDLRGTTIRKDEFVIPLMGSANRDPARYDSPDEMLFDRVNPRDHLAFIAGPRGCIGSGLARSEIREAIRIFLDEFPDVAFDPTQPRADYLGLAMRRFEPIHVILHSRP